MICVLYFVGWMNVFENGQGNNLWQFCHYSCQDKTTRRYRISPDQMCPKVIRDL